MGPNYITTASASLVTTLCRTGVAIKLVLYALKSYHRKQLSGTIRKGKRPYVGSRTQWFFRFLEGSDVAFSD